MVSHGFTWFHMVSHGFTWFHMVSHIQFHGGWLCHADSECFVFSSSTFGVFQCSLKT